MTKDELAKFNEVTPILKDLLTKGTKPVVHNRTKLQDDNSSVCGRYAAARVMNAQMPLEEFVAHLKSGPGTPDQKVTAYTYQFLHK
jgi:hypothetical protein